MAVLLAAAAIVLPESSQAYYHFLHYLTPKNASIAPEKFDLAALPNQTVTFFASESGPTTYSQNDSFNSVLGQIQQAAQIWNGIGSSAIRVAFGGLENPATTQNTPGGDVSFEDLPPGVEGFGGPTTWATPVTAADGSQFFPITRSVIHLSLNLNQAPGPSFDQSFLMTVLHEMGHALGLQHTFTSATMSQATTRATTLAHPISADDIAGLSVLYPNSSFSQFGSIMGTVTAGGQPVNMASVVAIQAGADAVSTITNSDGTYRIDGVPPGQYAVYVEAIPPDADIFGPNGGEITAYQAVNTMFYGGTTSFAQAGSVGVVAGQATTGINIQTTARLSVPIYDGEVYGFFGSNGITPAAVTISTSEAAVVASLVGLGTNEPVSNLSVQFPSGSVSIAPNGIVAAVANGYTYADLYLNFTANAQPGQQHMIFTEPDYTYVLPSAMYLTLTGPPTITGITSNGDGTDTITGTNWTAGTLLYFDSLPATMASLNLINNTAVVIPPPGSNNQISTLTAYNPDGQNSQMLQSAAPVTYSYGTLGTPSISSVSPASLPAGAEAMVDITGTGFSFQQGPTTIGFGTTDIAVQRVFVLSPNHIQADVSVSGNAVLGSTDVTAISGFQVATASAAFQITAAQEGLPAPYPVLFNGLPGLTGSYAGAIVSLYGTNLVLPNATPQVLIGGQAVTILYASASQINLVVPAGLPPGPAVMTVNNGALSAFPVDVNIDTIPGAIEAVQDSSGYYIDATSAAQQGETLIVTLGNFGYGAAIDPGRVQVSVGGVNHNASRVTAVQVGQTYYYQVAFQLNANDPVGQAEPLIVYLDGRSSYPATIPVVAASNASQ